MGKGEAAVHHETALRSGKGWAAAGLVEVDEGGRVGDVEGLKAEVLEDKLVGGALYGGDIEERLNQEEGSVGRVGMEKAAEHPIPNLPLEVRVDEVASVERTAKGQGGDIDLRRQELISHHPALTAGAGGSAKAVGHNCYGVPIAAEAGLTEPPAIVEDDHG